MKHNIKLEAIPKNAWHLTPYPRSPTIDDEAVLDGELAVP